MGENQTMMRMLLAVGLVMLLVSALYTGQNPAWATLQSSLSVGPSFPTWGNPYSLQTASVGLTIVGNATWGLSSTNFQYGQNAVSPVVVSNSGGPVNCAAGAHVTGVTAYPGQYWDCLNTKDGEASLVGMSGLRYTNADGALIDGYQFGVQLSNISGIDLRSQVLNVTIDTECNTQTANPVDFTVDIIKTVKTLGSWPRPPYLYPQQVSIGTGVPIGTTKCGYGTPPGPFGDTWFNVTNFINYQSGLYVSGQRLGNFSGAQMAVTINRWGQSVYISYMHVTINYLVDNSVTSQTCGGFDIGCVVSNIWNWLSTTIVFFIGGFIFAVQWVAALILFFIGIIVNFIIGFITVMIWFLAMPGVPPVVQAMIDVPFIAMLGGLFLAILSKIRGGSG